MLKCPGIITDAIAVGESTAGEKEKKEQEKRGAGEKRSRRKEEQKEKGAEGKRGRQYLEQEKRGAGEILSYSYNRYTIRI